MSGFFSRAPVAGDNTGLLILTLPSSKNVMEYQIEMIANNDIGGLLRFRYLIADGKPNFQYDVNGLAPLNDYIGVNGRSVRFLAETLMDISSTIGSLEKYLLEEKCLQLKTDMIYIDPARKGVKLVYLPAEPPEELQTRFSELVIDLVGGFRPEDATGKLYCRRIIEEVKKAGFRYEAFTDFLLDILCFSDGYANDGNDAAGQTAGQRIGAGPPNEAAGVFKTAAGSAKPDSRLNVFTRFIGERYKNLIKTKNVNPLPAVTAIFVAAAYFCVCAAVPEGLANGAAYRGAALVTAVGAELLLLRYFIMKNIVPETKQTNKKHRKSGFDAAVQAAASIYKAAVPEIGIAGGAGLADLWAGSVRDDIENEQSAGGASGGDGEGTPDNGSDGEKTPDNGSVQKDSAIRVDANVSAGAAKCVDADASAGAATRVDADMSAGVAKCVDVDVLAGVAKCMDVETSAGAAICVDADASAGAAKCLDAGKSVGAATRIDADASVGAAKCVDVDASADAATRVDTDMSAGAAYNVGADASTYADGSVNKVGVPDDVNGGYIQVDIPVGADGTVDNVIIPAEDIGAFANVRVFGHSEVGKDITGTAAGYGDLPPDGLLSGTARAANMFSTYAYEQPFVFTGAITNNKDSLTTADAIPPPETFNAINIKTVVPDARGVEAHDSLQTEVLPYMKEIDATLFVKGMMREFGVALNDNRFIIGRKREHADLALNNMAVGKTHAMLIKNDENWYIKDLSSKNGTYLNNMKIERGGLRPLENLDLITVANVDMVFTQLS